jgi:hypothetical protein
MVKLTDHQEAVFAVVERAVYYVPYSGEAVNISHWDTENEDEDGANPAFYGTGEESGEEFIIYFDEVDLDTDRFYKLALIDTKTVDKLAV